jgi:hypothetical protein
MSEIEEMEMFLFESLGFRPMYELMPKVTWTDDGATAQMTLDKRLLHLVKDRDEFSLFGVEGDGERELLKLKGSDPNFGNRILVAIGDFLANTGTR